MLSGTAFHSPYGQTHAITKDCWAGAGVITLLRVIAAGGWDDASLARSGETSVGETTSQSSFRADGTHSIESLTLWRRVFLFGCIQHAMIALGEPVIIRYGFIPVTLAACSLLFSGTKFEYIVAAKPSYGWIPCLWNSS